ncbi:MAG TPA: HAMP domain-containing sensor histidine kinase [Bacteroidales bacterium]|nr:HAMP domain-containing sensor histidine kinase [Bacteroidales bacterium]HRZ48809.1 HAMP domain-containing sensor histidine kinase [Bacteroidales bacterium]
MKLYTNIRKWRWILLGLAVVIVLASLWYTNLLVSKIKLEEERKVRIWAEAIERRVGLVNYTDDYFEKLKRVERERVRLWTEAIRQKSTVVTYTNDFFEKISNEERKRVELWAEANRIVSKADTGQELSFYLQILAGNTTIPIVITDEEGNIRTAANVDFDPAKVKKLSGALKKEFSGFAPIVSDNFGLINVIYYRESKLYTELRTMLDELTESFISDIVANAASVPVLVTDTSRTKVITSGNIDTSLLSQSNLPGLIAGMEQENPPIAITLGGRTPSLVFYENSRFYNTLKEIIDNHVQKFLEEVVSDASAIPVIITDSTRSKVVAFGGGVSAAEFDTPDKLQALVKNMTSHNPPIEINLPVQGKRFILYEDSFLLTQIRYYPVIQFLIIGLFIFAIYILLNLTRRSEQDQVWAGMAREAAHQLGTPISSLMAWIELLRSGVTSAETTVEITKDIDRLEAIAERFSKIGSTPELQQECLYDVVCESVDYMRVRTSRKITYTLYAEEQLRSILIPLNKNLFQWVIENLLRNAVDAMGTEGVIAISLMDGGKNILIDVEDTGKGIPKSKLKIVFTPGYTTKKRGWGLGLSLSDRIIRKYHKGKIFVKSSIPDRGTTFRIVLAK